jgi:toxin ParE1/3/4
LSTYRLGKKAESDLAGIVDYTVDNWGEEQAEAYIEQMAMCLQLLSGSQFLGRACEPLYPGLRRFEQGSHVIFYRATNEGIHVSRILHQSSLPTRKHFIDS